MNRVITFGEPLLRLSPPGKLRLTQTNTLEMEFGGAELNTAASLAQFGHPTAFVTRLPQNDVAEACLQQIRAFGIDPQHIQRGGERLGLYYYENGASQRAPVVTYDRAASAFAQLTPADYSWGTIFSGASWFHLTGITPALSPACAEAALAALQAARRAGVTVSCDLNYRSKLWSPAQAFATMQQLAPFIDYCLADAVATDVMLGIREENKVYRQPSDYLNLASEITQRYGCRGVTFTHRESFSASRNGWSAFFYTEGQSYLSRRYEMEIVDRIGAGDAFAAGLIHSLLQKKSAQESVDFAVAASCLKHTIIGDFNLATHAEVEALMTGDGAGRVQR
jgi:2-dehydro-3-deoxygluconokinase